MFTCLINQMRAPPRYRRIRWSARTALIHRAADVLLQFRQKLGWLSFKISGCDSDDICVSAALTTYTTSASFTKWMLSAIVKHGSVAEGVRSWAKHLPSLCFLGARPSGASRPYSDKLTVHSDNQTSVSKDGFPAFVEALLGAKRRELETLPIRAHACPTTEIVFGPMKTLGIPLDIAVEATCVFHRTTPAHEQTSFASCWSSDVNSHAQP